MQQKIAPAHNAEQDASHDGELQDVTGVQPQAEPLDALDDGFHDALEMLALSSTTGGPRIS